MKYFLEKIRNKASYETVDFYNIQNKSISEFQNEIIELIGKSFLVVTAVDGSIDKHLEIYLHKDNIKSELFKEACVIYPDSIEKFIAYINKMPEVSFFCCLKKPSDALLESIEQGYVEEFGNIARNTKLLQSIYNKMKVLNSSLYVSQGDCNLFIAIKKI